MEMESAVFLSVPVLLPVLPRRRSPARTSAPRAPKTRSQLGS